MLIALLAVATLQHGLPERVDGRDSIPAVAIAPDRPGFTTGAAVLGPHERQLETGVSFQRRGAMRQLSVGEALLRVGLWSTLELRVGLNSFGLATSDGVRDAGFEDASIGAKLLVPTVALMAMTSMPTGAPAFGRRGSEPEFTLIAGWTLPAEMSLTVNTGVASRVAATAGRLTEVSGGVSWATPIAAGVSAYAEYSAARIDGLTEHWGNTGLTCSPVATVQLDAWIARPMLGPRGSLQVGIGAARRW